MTKAGIKLDKIFEMHHLNMVWLKMQWWLVNKILIAQVDSYLKSLGELLILKAISFLDMVIWVLFSIR